ncbi:MAG: hypothetical protein VKI83_00310 [Synechococcaceae cyanobacterium]|nr:hypothetical protein [Synechococcaceae cyanobacterium]
MRHPFAALNAIQEQLLSSIESPFHLISGSEDCTLPEQQDRRWRAFQSHEQEIIRTIVEDPRVISWSIENLVRSWHPKCRPLPLGMVCPDPNLIERPPQRTIPPQSSRPTRLLCLHRIREGAQWDLRRSVSNLCRSELAGWSTVMDEEVPRLRFEQLLRQHAFVVCAQGGGIDPSPKAWLALLHGAIPIMRSSGLDAAYRQLPVMILEDWTAESLSWERLKACQRALAPWFDEPRHRREVLHRLSLDHWWTESTGAAPCGTDAVSPP